MTWKSALLRLIWSPPERRWWGGPIIAALGAGFGVRFYLDKGWIYGVSVAFGAVLLEALLFHLLVRRRRSSKDVAA